MDIRSKLRKLSLFLGFCFTLTYQLQAQISVNVQITPPFTPYLSDYDHLNFERVSVVITNTTSNPVDLTFKAYLKRDDGSIIAQTNVQSQPINLAVKLNAGESKNLQQADLDGIFSAARLEYDQSLIDQVALTGVIPEGIYQVCLIPYDNNTLQIMANEDECCSNELEIQYSEPPQIISVNTEECGGTLIGAKELGVVAITWSPTIVLGINQPRYRVIIHELLNNAVNPDDQVFSQSRPIAFIDDIQFPMVNFNPNNYGMMNNTRYIFRVQVYDPNNYILFQNNGFSQSCIFKMQRPEALDDLPEGVVSNYSATLTYPKQMDTLPFSVVPVVQKITPKSNQLESVKFNTQFLNIGLSLDLGEENTFTRTELRENTASNGVNFVTRKLPVGNYRYGNIYQINTVAELQNENYVLPQIAYTNTMYVAGMGHSMIKTVVQPGSKKNVKRITFVPSLPPDQLLPENRDKLLLNSLDNDGLQVEVKQTLCLEFSDDLNFLNPRRVAFKNYRFNYDLRTVSENQILSDLYSQTNWDVTLPDSSIALMRLVWLSNPDDTTSFGYHGSNIVMVNRDNISGVSLCIGVDSFTGMKVGATVCIAGGIKIKILRLDSQNRVSQGWFGRGWVEIPIWNKRFMIDFKNMTVEAGGTVTGGSAEAVHYREDLVPKNMSVADAQRFLNNESNRRTLFNNTAEEQADSVASTLPYVLSFGDAGTQLFVWKLVFDKDNASAYTYCRMPFKSDTLEFASFGNSVKPNCDNAGLMRLSLISDFDIPLPGANGNILKLKTQSAQGGSYLQFRCSGIFESGSLGGNLELDPSLFTAVEGESPSGMTIPFDASVDLNGNFISSFSLPKFHPGGVKQVTMDPATYYLDFSAIANHPVKQPPVQGADASWQGFYATNITAKVNQIFETTDTAGRSVNSNQNTNIQVNQLSISEQNGFNTKIYTSNILPYERGLALGGWRYGLDTFNLEFKNSRILKGLISGKIKTPLDSQNRYSALRLTLSRNQITGSVEMGNQIDFKPMGAKLSVVSSNAIINYNRNSGTTIRINMDADFAAKVNFPSSSDTLIASNGTLRGISITNIPGEYFNINDVVFRNLRIWKYEMATSNTQNSGPRREPMYFVKNRLPNQEIQFEFHFNGDITIGDQQFIKMTGGGHWGFKADTRGRFSTYSPVIDSFDITGNLGPMICRGKVAFYNNHNTYGTGFYGMLATDFELLGGRALIGLEYRTGRKSNYDYWYFYGAASISPAITIAPGLAWGGLGVKVGKHVRFGNTSNEVVPVSNTGLAFGGFVDLSSSPPEPSGNNAYKIKGGFEAELNQNYGVNRFRILAEIGIMGSKYPSEAQNTARTTEKIINGRGNITVDLVQKSFSATLEAYLYIPQPNSTTYLVKGSQSANKIGTLELLISARDMHLLIGTPQNPCGVSAKMLGINFDFTTYFMLGKNLPQAVLNPRIARFFPDFANGPRIESGFAHGSTWQLKTGKKSFLCFYGELDFLLGYDIGFGLAGACPGYPTPGVNGWYATGRMYGAGKAQVGINVDCPIYTGAIEILNAEVAAIVDGGFPNPTFVQGGIAGRYSVLDGWVTGSFNFDFQVGDVCTPSQNVVTESPVVGLTMIQSLTPSAQINNVRLDYKPQVVFNFVHNKTFDILVPNGDSARRRTFKVMDSVSFASKTIGTANFTNIPLNLAQVAREEDGFYTYQLVSQNEYLNANKTYRIYAESYFMEKGRNGIFTRALNKDNVPVPKEIKQVTFSTVPIANIESWMVTSQFPEANRSYVYTNQITGKINFNANVGGVFASNTRVMTHSVSSEVISLPRQVRVKYLAKFERISDGALAFVPISFTPNQNFIQYNTRDLDLNELYRFEILRLPTQTVRYEGVISAQNTTRFFPKDQILTQLSSLNTVSLSADRIKNYRNVMSGNNSVNVRDESNNNDNVSEQNATIDDEYINKYLEDKMYGGYFGTSRYANLSTKMNAVDKASVIVLNGQYMPITVMFPGEPLCESDFDNTNNTPEVVIRANSNNEFIRQLNDYYTEVNQLLSLDLLRPIFFRNYHHYNSTTNRFEATVANTFEALNPAYTVSPNLADPENWYRRMEHESTVLSGGQDGRLTQIQNQAITIKEFCFMVMNRRLPGYTVTNYQLNVDSRTGKAYTNSSIADSAVRYDRLEMDGVFGKLWTITQRAPIYRTVGGNRDWSIDFYSTEDAFKTVFNSPTTPTEAFSIPLSTPSQPNSGNINNTQNNWQQFNNSNNNNYRYRRP